MDINLKLFALKITQDQLEKVLLKGGVFAKNPKDMEKIRGKAFNAMQSGGRYFYNDLLGVTVVKGNNLVIIPQRSPNLNNFKDKGFTSFGNLQDDYLKKIIDNIASYLNKGELLKSFTKSDFNIDGRKFTGLFCDGNVLVLTA